MRRLTGRIDFRRTFWGRIVLQVEEESVARWSLRREKPLRRRWRSATVIDLTKVEMRPLIDLRNRRSAPPRPLEPTPEAAQGPAAPPPIAAKEPVRAATAAA